MTNRHTPEGWLASYNAGEFAGQPLSVADATALAMQMTEQLVAVIKAVKESHGCLATHAGIHTDHENRLRNLEEKSNPCH